MGEAVLLKQLILNGCNLNCDETDVYSSDGNRQGSVCLCSILKPSLGITGQAVRSHTLENICLMKCYLVEFLNIAYMEFRS